MTVRSPTTAAPPTVASTRHPTRPSRSSVTPVNDAPSFAKGGDVVVAEDSGAYGPTAWATALSAGPANESTQTLEFTTAAINTDLFSTQPAVNAAGELSFTPAADANGSTLVTVFATDNGGTPGDPTSTSRTFTITITPVNDQPVVVLTTPLAEYIEGDGNVAIDAEPVSFTVTDIDSTFLSNLTVRITAGANTGIDTLACPACDELGITAAFSLTSNRLTLSGPASPADYQTALQSVTFGNASDTPTGADRVLTVIANDGAAASAPATMTFGFVVRSTIVIVKNAQPKDAQDFDFSGDLGSFTLDDDAGADDEDNVYSNSVTFEDILPGQHLVTEALTSGWDLTALSCTDGNSLGDTLTRTATINLEPGEVVTCTFTNDNLGTITIAKDAVDDDAQAFAFTADGGLTPASFDLADDRLDPELPGLRECRPWYHLHGVGGRAPHRLGVDRHRLHLRRRGHHVQLRRQLRRHHPGLRRRHGELHVREHRTGLHRDQ